MPFVTGEADSAKATKANVAKTAKVTKEFLQGLQAAGPKKLKSSAAVAPDQRHGDRGDVDDPDEDDPGLLPVYVRFYDIRKARIARNWPALLRLIKDEGF